MRPPPLYLALLLLWPLAGCVSDVEGDAAGECDDGVDNDQDGLTDCADDTCANATVCTGSGDDDDDDDSTGDDDDDSTGDDDDDSTGDDDDDSTGDDDDDSAGDDDDDDSAGDDDDDDDDDSAGDDDDDDDSAPVDAWLEVAVGPFHSCARQLDGSVSCWGSDDGGRASPPVDAFAHLATGLNASCGILSSDGSIDCWGSGSAAAAFAESYQAIDMRGEVGCAVRSDDGSMFCWGSTTAPPEGVFIDAHVAGPGSDDLCGRDAAGALSCVGWPTPSGTWSDWDGRCGVDASSGEIACFAPDGSLEQTVDGAVYQAVADGGALRCGLEDSGAVYCWGANQDNAAIAPAGAYRSLSVDARHVCAVAEDDAVDCWGADDLTMSTPPLPGENLTDPGDFSDSWVYVRSLSPATTDEPVYYRVEPAAHYGLEGPLATLAVVDAAGLPVAGSSSWSGRAGIRQLVFTPDARFDSLSDYSTQARWDRVTTHAHWSTDEFGLPVTADLEGAVFETSSSELIVAGGDAILASMIEELGFLLGVVSTEGEELRLRGGRFAEFGGQELCTPTLDWSPAPWPADSHGFSVSAESFAAATTSSGLERWELLDLAMDGDIAPDGESARVLWQGWLRESSLFEMIGGGSSGDVCALIESFGLSLCDACPDGSEPNCLLLEAEAILQRDDALAPLEDQGDGCLSDACAVEGWCLTTPGEVGWVSFSGSYVLPATSPGSSELAIDSVTSGTYYDTGLAPICTFASPSTTVVSLGLGLAPGCSTCDGLLSHSAHGAAEGCEGLPPLVSEPMNPELLDAWLASQALMPAGAAPVESVEGMTLELLRDDLAGLGLVQPSFTMRDVAVTGAEFGTDAGPWSYTGYLISVDGHTGVGQEGAYEWFDALWIPPPAPPEPPAPERWGPCTPPDPYAPTGVGFGEQFPDFSAPDQFDEEVSVACFGGSVVVIVFDAMWSGPSITWADQAQGQLEALRASVEYDVVFIEALAFNAVSWDATLDDRQAWATDRGLIDIPVLGGDEAGDFGSGLASYPTFFVLRPDLRVHAIHEGWVGTATLNWSIQDAWDYWTFGPPAP